MRPQDPHGDGTGLRFETGAVRFVQRYDWHEVQDLYELPAGPTRNLQAHYNIAPIDPVGSSGQRPKARASWSQCAGAGCLLPDNLNCASLFNATTTGSPVSGFFYLSCTIIVTDANALRRPIHDRMPVILEKVRYRAMAERRGGHRAAKASRGRSPSRVACVETCQQDRYRRRLSDTA